MPDGKPDAVKLVRELLGSGAILLPLRVEGWHKSLTDGGWFIKHATGRTLATVEFVPVEIETGRPALDGNAPARAIVALLNAIPTLADEVERLRERFSVVCNECGERYLGPKDESLRCLWRNRNEFTRL